MINREDILPLTSRNEKGRHGNLGPLTVNQYLLKDLDRLQMREFREQNWEAQVHGVVGIHDIDAVVINTKEHKIWLDEVVNEPNTYRSIGFDPFEKRERAFKKKYKYRIDELEEIAKKENIRIEFDSLSEGK